MLRPESVEQMIQVLVRFKDKYSRSYNVDKAHNEAIEEVAKMHNHKGSTTVRDLCFRRLDLPSVFKFRNLLEKWMLGEPKPLFELLKRFTPSRFHAEIEGILVEGVSNMASLLRNTTKSSVKIPQRLDENFSFSLDPEMAKKLKVLALMEGVSNSDWSKKRIIDLVNQEYATWLNNQRENN